MAAGPAEGTDRIELQRAAHFQGAKNVLVPIFVNVSSRQNQATGKEGSWCAQCQRPWWRAERHATTGSYGSSKRSSPRVLLRPQRGTRGPPLHPIPREGPWVRPGEQRQGWKRSRQNCKTNPISSEGCRILLPRFYRQKCLEWSNR